jgi:hypothetical protein
MSLLQRSHEVHGLLGLPVVAAVPAKTANKPLIKNRTFTVQLM